MVEKYIRRQVLLSTAPLFNSICCGMTYGYSGVLTLHSNDPNSDTHLDMQTISWIASMPGNAAIVAAILLGVFMDVFGRKKTYMFITIIGGAGWLLSAVTKSVPALLVGSFLTGTFHGAVFFFAICMSEISNPSLRAWLLLLKPFATAMGIFIVHIFGFFFNRRLISVIGFGLCAAGLCVSCFWPETPEWLTMKGRYQEAEEIFYSIRGKTLESEKEITKLIHAEKNRVKTNTLTGLKSFMHKFFSKLLWRPLVVLFCLKIYLEVSGIHYFPSYSVQLVSELTGKQDSFLYVILFDLNILAGTFFSALFVNKFPKRKLLITAGVTQIILLLIICLSLYLRGIYLKDCQEFLWFILSLLVLYSFLLPGGVLAVLHIFMGELLPLEVRGIGTLLTNIVTGVLMAVLSKIFPLLITKLGLAGMLLLFSVIMVLTLLYVLYDVPETKDKTLYDISLYYRNKVVDDDEDKYEENACLNVSA